MGLGLNPRAQIYANIAYMYINKGIGRQNQVEDLKIDFSSLTAHHQTFWNHRILHPIRFQYEI